jgi:hypothetical protein
LKHWKQKVGEQERTKMIGADEGFNSIYGFNPPRKRHADAIDQHIQPVVPAFELLDQGTDGLLRGNVCEQQRNRVAPAPGSGRYRFGHPQ